jgi:hypothetical protein
MPGEIIDGCIEIRLALNGDRGVRQAGLHHR